MKRLKCLFWALFCLMLCGCAAVYSTDPIGEEPCRIFEQDWEGTWINRETFLLVKVTDGSNGMLHVAWIETSDKGDRLESYDIQLRQSGQMVFGNVKTKDGNGKVLYVWGLVKHEGSEFICWRPDPDKFKALCGRGTLPCREEEGNIVLTGLTPQNFDTINSEKEGVLYEWRNPLVFLRMPGHGK